MTNQPDLSEIFGPIKNMAAICIGLGGAMHAMGLTYSVIDGQSFAWWFWAIFLIAIAGYLTSAILIVKNIWAGYFFAVAAPVVGGILIFFGFIFPQSGLLILIPGTYVNEIRIIGFITLISEPIAVVLAGLCIKHKAWKLT